MPEARLVCEQDAAIPGTLEVVPAKRDHTTTTTTTKRVLDPVGFKVYRGFVLERALPDLQGPEVAFMPLLANEC